jgi:hypothetical protein
MPLSINRIRYLRRELRKERISYGELYEIQCAADQAGVEAEDGNAREALDRLEEIAKAVKP